MSIIETKFSILHILTFTWWNSVTGDGEIWAKNHLVRDSFCNIANLECMISFYFTRNDNLNVRFTFSVSDTTQTTYNWSWARQIESVTLNIVSVVSQGGVQIAAPPFSWPLFRPRVKKHISFVPRPQGGWIPCTTNNRPPTLIGAGHQWTIPTSRGHF
jgi:hypothetical protein